MWERQNKTRDEARVQWCVPNRPQLAKKQSNDHKQIPVELRIYFIPQMFLKSSVQSGNWAIFTNHTGVCPFVNLLKSLMTHHVSVRTSIWADCEDGLNVPNCCHGYF